MHQDSDTRPSAEVMAYIARQKKETGLPPPKINILDWGCGRGRSVYELRKLGYQAFGVDIDPAELRIGRAALGAAGFDEDLLFELDKTGRAPFPDGFFEIIFSEVVFEHVQDLTNAIAEIRRLTGPGGYGYHVIPAHRGIVEGHLQVPFVHWLPKNNLRWLYLWACYSLGIGGAQNEEESRLGTASKKASFQCSYCNGRTFYRSARFYQDAFKEYGFDAYFDEPNLARLQGLVPSWLLKSKLLQPILSWAYRNFRMILLVTRPRDKVAVVSRKVVSEARRQ